MEILISIYNIFMPLKVFQFTFHHTLGGVDMQYIQTCLHSNFNCIDIIPIPLKPQFAT